MAAAKSQQDASVLATLIQLRADVNARARTGLVAMSFCRTPEQVKVMVEHRADMPPSSLSGIASFGGPETMKVLLSCRCDINQTEENRYGPLHATTLFSRGNCRAVETAKFLLAQHADVNARTVLRISASMVCTDSVVNICKTMNTPSPEVEPTRTLSQFKNPDMSAVKP